MPERTTDKSLRDLHICNIDYFPPERRQNNNLHATYNRKTFIFQSFHNRLEVFSCKKVIGINIDA